MTEKEVTSVYCLEAVKKRIKFLESSDPNNVILKLLKQQIPINVSEEVKG
jgi:hypothetical protein